AEQLAEEAAFVHAGRGPLLHGLLGRDPTGLDGALCLADPATAGGAAFLQLCLAVMGPGLDVGDDPGPARLNLLLREVRAAAQGVAHNPARDLALGGPARVMLRVLERGHEVQRVDLAHDRGEELARSFAA